jgi:hypothetical protein
MRALFSVFTILMLAGAASLAAQSDQDVNTYFTLVGTPQGGLPPVLSPAMLGRSMVNPELGLRYGHISTAGTDFNNFGATLGIPAGTKAMIGITAGAEALSCGGCKTHFIASANAEGRLASTLLGTGSDAARLNIGLNGEFGFGKPEGTTLVSLTAGLPIALVATGTSFRIAPFVTPGLGWGRVSDNTGSSNGTRFMVGGGVALEGTRSPISANFGFQKVLIDGGDVLFGFNVMFALK